VRITALNIREASAAVDLACQLTQPADAVLRQFFRARHDLGSHDRALIAEIVYSILRHKRLLETIVPDATPRRLVIASLVKLQGMSIGSLGAVVSDEDRDWLVAVKRADAEALSPAVRLSLPDWLWDRLSVQLGSEEATALARALLVPAPLDLRVNTLIANRESVLAELQRDGIEGAATRYSPVGIRLAGHPAINRHRLYASGAIEVQDEGSQLLGFLLAPKRREMAVDFCAGAGGKTLLLGALMQNQGRLYAFDVSEKRLNGLRPRLKRSGLSNIHPQLLANEKDAKVRRLAGKIDRVLIDAPCSGLGTLRRNPDMKWRQSPEWLEELKAKQRAILGAAATLLKPGGRLVYATCSLLREENEDIVEEFLAAQPAFRSISAQEVLDTQRIALETGPLFRVYPHRHGTDGFFAAVLERHT
jgi:16S rRNA (cytosine967-C5)-methyltransferase